MTSEEHPSGLNDPAGESKTGESQGGESAEVSWQISLGRLLRFLSEFLVTSFLWAAALSLVITLLWKGIPILRHGVPMCDLLIKANRPDLILRSSCGCALVEIIAFPIGLLGVIILSPRLFRLFVSVRAFRQRSGGGPAQTKP